MRGLSSSIWYLYDLSGPSSASGGFRVVGLYMCGVCMLGISMLDWTLPGVVYAAMGYQNAMWMTIENKKMKNASCSLVNEQRKRC